MLEDEILRRTSLRSSVTNAELRALKSEAVILHSSTMEKSQKISGTSGTESIPPVEVVEEYVANVSNSFSF